MTIDLRNFIGGITIIVYAMVYRGWNIWSWVLFACLLALGAAFILHGIGRGSLHINTTKKQAPAAPTA